MLTAAQRLLQSRVSLEQDGVLAPSLFVGGRFSKHKTIIPFLLEIMLNLYLPPVLRLVLHNGE